MMRELYLSPRVEALQAAAPPVLEAARALRLWEQSSHRVTLTPTGYLVGNVAKEFCNFIDNHRVMPPPTPPEEFYRGKDVLDMGCSFGRWLWIFQKFARSVQGLEMQQEYLEMGRALSGLEGVPFPSIRQGSIENVDKLVGDATFDFIFCRLVLNHVHIKDTLAKAVARLRPGGVFWIQVASLSELFRGLVKGEEGLRHKGFTAFAIFNSFLCMATNRQMALRVQGRMHSTHQPANPSLWWWKRTLGGLGLDEFQVVRKERYDLTFYARKLR